VSPFKIESYEKQIGKHLAIAQIPEGVLSLKYGKVSGELTAI
jgi:hypothetical protein